MRSLDRARLPSLWLWTICLCVASQLPYFLVWSGASTFPYDAFTTFNPWLVGQLGELRAGEAILALYQDEVPFDVWPSYFFSGVLRQLLVFIQANTAIGHAIVQAVHVVLMVPAVALLCRSFEVPWKYGILGGFVFTLTGIHVSLSQHVLAHEALLYLVLSLYSIRELILGWYAASTPRRATLFGMTGVLMISLVRVYHEAILYVVPFAAWVLGHLFLLRGRDGSGRTMVQACGVMVILGALVALASVPMLLAAYELSLVNKTAIESYTELGPYFSDMRAFFMSLVLPGFSGGNSPTLPLRFDFHQEATLSYVFLGSLSLPLLAVVLSTWWQDGRRASALAMLATMVVVVGYSVGAGSPIHRLLCLVFPFLVNIGHNYYGLHLVYLLAAFSVAAGIHIVVQRDRYTLLGVAALVQAGLIFFAVDRALDAAGWGVQGSFDAFTDVVIGDLRWHFLVLLLLGGLVFAARLRVYGETVLGRIRLRAGTARTQALVLGALSLLVGVDMLRPVLSAHFIPNSGWVSWALGPLGGFNPSRDIRDFLAVEQAAQERPLRVVPIFPRGGGWQGNALMVTDMHLVGTPGDSGGNRYVNGWLSEAPTPARISEFIERLGIDVVWVSRWGVDEWQAALEATPDLEKVYSSPHGGDLYVPRGDSATRYAIKEGVLAAPWHHEAGDVVVEQGLVARTWHFDLPDDPHASRVELPLMWHAGYSVELRDGTDVAWGRTGDGTVFATLPADVSGSPTTDLVVRYPNEPLSFLVTTAAAVYLALLTLLGWGCMRLWRGSGR